MSKKPPAAKADLEVILKRIRALEERIARLEGESIAAAGAAADFAVLALPVSDAPAAPAPTPVSVDAEEVPEEILLVLSAAVAAYLGERAHVRQVRLLHSDAWAQQGRVSVMASHRWAVHR